MLLTLRLIAPSSDKDHMHHSSDIHHVLDSHGEKMVHSSLLCYTLKLALILFQPHPDHQHLLSHTGKRHESEVFDLPDEVPSCLIPHNIMALQAVSQLGHGHPVGSQLGSSSVDHDFMSVRPLIYYTSLLWLFLA